MNSRELVNDILFGRKQIGKEYGFTIGIHSPARTGKTLTGVMFIISILLRWEHIKGVVSNVVLDLEPIEDLGKEYIPLKDIKMIKNEEYQNYIIYTDEFKRYIDARMSASFKNLFISNLLADTGKQKQIHILTDQNASAIDKRVRGNTDLIIHPRIDLTTKLCTCKFFGGSNPYNTYFTEDAYNRIGWWKNEFIYEVEEYYQYFDTEQKIEEYFITFTPNEYADDLIAWLEEKNYLDNERFTVKKATIQLWKQVTGVHITGEQISSLMEYLLLETDLPMKGR